MTRFRRDAAVPGRAARRPGVEHSPRSRHRAPLGEAEPLGTAHRRQHRRRRDRRDGHHRCVDLGGAHLGAAAVQQACAARHGWRSAGARRRGARLGLHLLLEPPHPAREPVPVGDPRRAPLERALQPVDRAASAVGGVARACSCPTAPLSLLGIRPDLIETARQLNLLYQFWIHTDAIRTIGPLEEVLNTPSHHRAHHGSNRRYLDRNHGSILIVWDRLFGTFERERADDPVVYGLTKNIETFNPLRIADPRVRRHRERRRRRAHLGRSPVVRAARARAGPTSAVPGDPAARRRRSRRPPRRPDARARPAVVGARRRWHHLTHCQISPRGNHAHRCRHRLRGPHAHRHRLQGLADRRRRLGAGRGRHRRRGRALRRPRRAHRGHRLRRVDAGRRQRRPLRRQPARA